MRGVFVLMRALTVISQCIVNLDIFKLVLTNRNEMGVVGPISAKGQCPEKIDNLSSQPLL